MIQQIILDGVYLPRRSRDQYRCWEDILKETKVMVSGRMTQELRNRGKRFKVWKASVTYDALDETTYFAALEVLRRGTEFPAAVLPDNSEEMVSSVFLVERLTPASFAFESAGKPVWHGLSFQIREVSPHA